MEFLLTSAICNLSRKNPSGREQVTRAKLQSNKASRMVTQAYWNLARVYVDSRSCEKECEALYWATLIIRLVQNVMDPFQCLPRTSILFYIFINNYKCSAWIHISCCRHSHVLSWKSWPFLANLNPKPLTLIQRKCIHPQPRIQNFLVLMIQRAIC